MAAVAVKYPAFEELDAEVLTISVDPVSTHQKWQEQELSKMVQGGARFPMVSDPRGEIGSRYGVYDEDQRVDLRGRFLIDPDGILQSAEIIAAPIGRDISEVLRQLRAFQHHRKTGELMPCGWQPGKPTLPPEREASQIAGKVWESWKPSKAF